MAADGVGRLPLVHPDQDEQLSERKARERHADADARRHEEKFSDYGHTGTPHRNVRAVQFASLADDSGGVCSEGAPFLPRQLHGCVGPCFVAY